MGAVSRFRDRLIAFLAGGTRVSSPCSWRQSSSIILVAPAPAALPGVPPSLAARHLRRRQFGRAVLLQVHQLLLGKSRSPVGSQLLGPAYILPAWRLLHHLPEDRLPGGCLARPAAALPPDRLRAVRIVLSAVDRRPDRASQGADPAAAAARSGDPAAEQLQPWDQRLRHWPGQKGVHRRLARDLCRPAVSCCGTGPAAQQLRGVGRHLAYALQLYFDFSGYCDMAIGLGARCSASYCRRTSARPTRRFASSISGGGGTSPVALSPRLSLHPARRQSLWSLE